MRISILTNNNLFFFKLIFLSLIILADQIRRIYKKIEKATSTDVLSIDRFQPVYIYIEDPFLQGNVVC